MPSVALDFDDTPTVSLESQMERLALEAGAISNVIDSFKNIVPALADRLRVAYSSLTSGDDDLTKELKDTKNRFGQKVQPKLGYAKYMSFEKTLISVPEGFKGDLLSYLATLASMSQEIFAEANKTLGSYNFALAAFVTNKESKTALQDHSHLFHQVTKRREELTSKLAVYFPKPSTLSKAYLGDTIGRFADVEVLIAEAEKLNLQRKNQNIKDISDSVKKAVDLLDIIIKDTQTNGIAKVSGAAAMNISEGAYELGKYVEFISIYRFRVEQAIASVSKLVETLERVL